ncbi:primosomal protein DnaI [Anaerovibrio lipolyticus DSM 3074]|uniref:Primosomal protein DnaI n=2 Tax=Anaerovibrio lipolyticus TaxID=82374 RepID=A0A1M6C5A2_9FIRM|nr:primosomal protein DnaI [Anaerovibrio lipolyticus DSM 3074]
MNGLPSGDEPIDPKELCKECIGLSYCKQEITGMVPVEEEYYGSVRTRLHFCQYEARKRGQEKVDRLFRDAKIPERYTDCGWSDFHINSHNQEAVNAAYEVIEKQSGAIFYGNRGTGKTMLVSIIANEMAKNGVPVLFTSVPELFDAIRSRFTTGNAKDIVDGVKDADFLILDDMGTEKMTDWVSEQLFIIINHRYNRNLPLVITTNYDPRTFAAKLCIQSKDGLDKIPAERIMSRLKAMCKFVKVAGGDWRMQEVQ